MLKCFLVFLSLSVLADSAPYVDLTHPNKDSIVLKKFFSSSHQNKVDDALIIGLGESGHGVAEFHLQRFRLIKYFIQTKNFREVYLEGPLLLTEPLTNILHQCSTQEITTQMLRSVAQKSLEPMIYGHEEFMELITWLCHWNRTKPKEEVTLRGIDLWDTLWSLRDEIWLSFDKMQLNEAFSKRFEQARENCFYWKVSSSEEAKKSDDYKKYLETLRLDPTKTSLCGAALKWMVWDLESIKKDLILKYGEFSFARLMLLIDAALTREQVRDAQNFEFFKAMNLRDAFQARAILRFQSLSRSPKVLALLHNVHVGKAMSQMRSDVVTPSDRFPGQVFISSGEILKGALGQKYFSIGVGGYKLSSIRDGDYPLPAEKDSLDLKLSTRCKNFCLVDTTLMNKPLWMHNETAVKGMYGVPSEQFDAYYYIRESKAATALK